MFEAENNRDLLSLQRLSELQKRRVYAQERKLREDLAASKAAEKSAIDAVSGSTSAANGRYVR